MEYRPSFGTNVFDGILAGGFVFYACNTTPVDLYDDLEVEMVAAGLTGWICSPACGPPDPGPAIYPDFTLYPQTFSYFSAPPK